MSSERQDGAVGAEVVNSERCAGHASDSGAAVGAEVASNERSAAMAWTRLAEGEDVYANRLIETHGYSGALDYLRAYAEGGAVADPGMRRACERWAGRLNEERFQADARQSIAEFLMPGDPNWPEGLNILGETRPLGLWLRGNAKVLARPSVAIVGSRDCSAYGSKVATDISFDLASEGMAVISGGAIGIDACAHRGALAAGGATIAVAACGVDRFYPMTNADLYLAILEAGGVLVSENPVGVAPHRHRFLSRNRIIAAIGSATVVVEAHHRSGALSTAHHAMTAGRDVGAVPGPVTSAYSQGCHRLLREGATCVTSTRDVLELCTPMLPFEDGAWDGGRRGVGTNDGAQRADARNDARAHLSPLSTRVLDALPVRGGIGTDKVAVVAGVSVPEALAGLGDLERLGMVRRDGTRWIQTR